ncbi:S41 family peptidase [Hanstruepera marina]|uniref:S41 family peptidase n=1 Tax=Hanstruepera marina TaxID=2873265 RepID=UPI001CA64584|nr:S41 family peptidase [Hanstruepera marina]
MVIKNINRFLAVLTFLCVTTSLCAQNSKSIIQLADSLSNLYVFKDKGIEMSNLLKSNLERRNYDNLNLEELAVHLDKDLKKVVKDKHLRISYGQPKRNTSQRRQIPSYYLSISESKVLDGNIGYIEITGFQMPNDDLKNHLSTQLMKIAKCKAIIIDLRNNGGGAPKGVQLLSSYFFEKDTTQLLNTVEYRGYDVKYDFYVLGDADIERILDKKTYILTSNYTFSAGEGFAYLMQANKKATLVGENTGGGAHPVNFYPLDNGLVAKIPIGRAINPITNSNWEGIGVIPDIKVEEEKALSKAIEIIRKN